MSEQIPYQPIGKRKQVSFGRMQEILAKHAQKAPQVQPPKAELQESGITWKRVAPLAIESSCGNFRIEKQEQAGMWLYECMRKSPDWWVRFATEKTAEAAKARCK